MVLDDQIGRRLPAVMIDSYARHEPDRTWAVVPIDDADLSKGFRDISYNQFSDSVDRAARWLMGKMRIGDRHERETVAYAGPKDLRYPIFAVAALKCNVQLLLCSPYATAMAQLHLLTESKCTTYFHTSEMSCVVLSVLDNSPDIASIEVPAINEWLDGAHVEHVPYVKTWDDAADDVWLIIHSSGTTGIPKLIRYTNAMMAAFDIAKLMPDAEPESRTLNGMLRERRCYTSFPKLHFLGMCAALQWTLYLNTVLVMGPTESPSGRQVLDIIRYSGADVVCLPPSVIDDVCREPDGGLKAMQQLFCILFAGAPLSRRVAESLAEHCHVVPAMGSTEAGAYWLGVDGPEDWEYYRIRPSNGIVMEQRGENIYELVFRRQPGLERWQQLFKVYPDQNEFHTKDLWSPHPDRPNTWRYAGRTDDMVMFDHGEGLLTAKMESVLQEHERVRAALIGGNGKPWPFVIIDLIDRPVLTEDEKAAVLEDIWPFAERANELCSELVRLKREFFIFSDPNAPLPLTAKQTVIRNEALELYKDKVEVLYASHVEP